MDHEPAKPYSSPNDRDGTSNCQSAPGFVYDTGRTGTERILDTGRTDIERTLDTDRTDTERTLKSRG